MKRKTVVAVAISTAAVLALGAGYTWSVANDRPTVGVAEVAEAPLSVTVSASGTLVAAQTAGVYPATAGTLASVKVHDGDQVKSGQTLAVLAKGPLSLAVAQAKAAHTAALAQQDAVRNGVPSAIERSAANSALSAARSGVSTATKNYNSYLADYRDASGAMRKSMRPTLRSLKTAKATANANLLAAQASLSRLSRASQVSMAMAAANQAATATAKALASARDHLEAATLVAPFAGTVSFVGTVEKGSGVTPGVPVFKVIQPSRMDFEAQVYETDIAAVQKGQAATVTLDAFDTPIAGKVSRLQASPVSTSTGTVAFGVRISLDATEARLFQGMSGSAEIAVNSIPNALVVPVEAVLTDGSAKRVFLVGADNIVHAKQVTVGASTDTSVEILTGLAAGDRVATTGASGLSEGQSVRTG